MRKLFLLIVVVLFVFTGCAWVILPGTYIEGEEPRPAIRVRIIDENPFGTPFVEWSWTATRLGVLEVFTFRQYTTRSILTVTGRSGHTEYTGKRIEDIVRRNDEIHSFRIGNRRFINNRSPVRISN